MNPVLPANNLDIQSWSEERTLKATCELQEGESCKENISHIDSEAGHRSSKKLYLSIPHVICVWAASS
jgi:hypothetical protein